MALYFVRHGQAEAGTGKLDEARELTPDGVRRIKNAAQVLRRMGIAPEHIYSSPRVRAQQTAQHIATAVGKTVDVHPALDFDFGPEAVADFVAAHGNIDLMFVGHEPTMSGTLATLTGAEVVMQPGSVGCVRLTSQAGLRGELMWFGAPSLFDAVAED